MPDSARPQRSRRRTQSAISTRSFVTTLKFANLQVWKPLKGPVRSAPLGLVDASTLEKTDFTAIKIHFPERTGQIMTVHHNKNHR